MLHVAFAFVFRHDMEVKRQENNQPHKIALLVGPQAVVSRSAAVYTAACATRCDLRLTLCLTSCMG